jgi:hypothetical protein
MPCSGIVLGTVQFINEAVSNHEAVCIILYEIMKLGKEIALGRKEVYYSLPHYLTKCYIEIVVNTTGLMSF